MSSLFNRMAKPGPPHLPSAFSLAADPKHPDILNLFVLPIGSREQPAMLWTCCLDTTADRDAVLAAVDDGTLDLPFLGRITTFFGDSQIRLAVLKVVERAQFAREKAEEEALETAHKDNMVHLYVPKTKYGYALQLRRDSRRTPDWQVVYDRQAERDRLCDWLRWQQSRFLEFLEVVASDGDEALTQALLNEMFATERRVKKEGRGAGGLRPLRMWRGA